MNLHSLSDMAVKAVSQAVMRGLDDRVSEEYILHFDDLSDGLELDSNDKNLFIKYALEAFRAHPEVKNIGLFDDVNKAFLAFHTPFSIEHTLFKTLNNMTPAFISGSEEYALFTSPKDKAKDIILEKNDDSGCVIMTQLVQAGSCIIRDIQMQIMIDVRQSTAKAVSFCREGAEKRIKLCIYEDDGSINNRTAGRLNRFLSDWLIDMQRRGFKEKRLKTIAVTEIEREQDEIEPPRCHKCRYKSHGFICWGSDGSCMRTWVDKNNKTEGNTVYEKSGNLPAK